MINQELINQIAPMLATCVLGVVTAIVKTIGDAAIDYICKKRDAVVEQIGIDKYNSNLAIAKNVWNMVDEEFRITPTLAKTIESAQSMFTDKLLKVIPGLTADEIEHLRQTVAGEVNKGKAALTPPVEVAPTVVTATVKYVSPDGTELRPVDTQNEQTTSDTSQANQAV